MFKVVNFLADMISPYAYYDPNTGEIMDLRIYIVGGFVTIILVTVGVVWLLVKRSKKDRKKQKNDSNNNDANK